MKRMPFVANCLLLLLVSSYASYGQNAKAEKPTGLVDNAKAIAQLEKVKAKFGRNQHGNITSVFLGGRTTNDTLALLGKLPRLEKLEIHCAAKVTDEGLVHLSGLSGLKSLLFGYVKITDQGMIHLRKLSNLEVLHLGIGFKAEFNDGGLVHLKNLKKLRKLDFSYTRVSDEAMEKLKAELPECRISRTNSVPDSKRKSP